MCKKRQRMFPFRRRKNPAEIHLAFQRAAEDWLRLPGGAQSDTVVLQAGRGGSQLRQKTTHKMTLEKAKLSVTVLPPPGSRVEPLRSEYPPGAPADPRGLLKLNRTRWRIW